MRTIYHFEVHPDILTNFQPIKSSFEFPEHNKIRSQGVDFYSLKLLLEEAAAINPIFKNIQQPQKNDTEDFYNPGRNFKISNFLKFEFKDNLSSFFLFITRNKLIKKIPQKLSKKFLFIPEICYLDFKTYQKNRYETYDLQPSQTRFGSKIFLKNFFFKKKNSFTEENEKFLVEKIDLEEFESFTWDPLIHLITEKEIQTDFISKSECPYLHKLIDHFIVFDIEAPSSGFRYYGIYEHQTCTLRELIEERRLKNDPHPEYLILKIALDTISGLAALNRLNIAHRDIKPENILYNHETQNYSISNFGLAYIKDSNSPDYYIESGSFVGTPLYQTIDYFNNIYVKDRKLFFSIDVMKSDLYSVGVMLLELFSGVLSVANGSSVNTFYELISAESLNDVETYCELCEQKFLLHNHMISILK